MPVKDALPILTAILPCCINWQRGRKCSSREDSALSLQHGEINTSCSKRTGWKQLWSSILRQITLGSWTDGQFCRSRGHPCCSKGQTRGRITQQCSLSMLRTEGSKLGKGYYFVSDPEVQEKVEISSKPGESPNCDDLHEAEFMSPVAALWEMVFPNHFHFWDFSCFTPGQICDL